ncbi:MAG: 6,7-dimethyl-8-ribityllumazine synthase [Bacteroidaceae bacterium]|jgi:6,7-dimethyl-8-ribityllumazine synthase
MATANHNLSQYNPEELKLKAIDQVRFGIVVSDWNSDITSKLLEGAVETLLAQGANKDNIFIKHVPGSFELVYGAKQMINRYHTHAVIALGCVIQGETPHFTYVCQGVTQGIAALNATGNIPVIYGLLTTLNKEQAEARAGGELRNKGTEGAVTAIKMLQAFPAQFM